MDTVTPTRAGWTDVLRACVADLRHVMNRARQGRYGVRNDAVTSILESLEEATPRVISCCDERELGLRQCIITAQKAWERLTRDGQHSPECSHMDPEAIKRCCGFHACSCGLNALLQDLKAAVSIQLTLPE